MRGYFSEGSRQNVVFVYFNVEIQIIAMCDMTQNSSSYNKMTNIHVKVLSVLSARGWSPARAGVFFRR